MLNGILWILRTGAPWADLPDRTQMRQTIRSSVPPDAAEAISYRIPAFKRGQVLVWYGRSPGT